MGNCCSTSSDPSPFDQPGRTLCSAPPKPAPSKSTLPPSVSASASTVPRTYTVGGPARTLGSGSSGTKEDARRKAAEAAEARLSSKKPKGALGKKLQEEQSQTLKTTRENTSAAERQAREADLAAEARAYN
ncbi:uncharacterized protein EAE97_002462 [Botrytis byssoidea]|uniref:Uncharacterized protein n=1 Tax=Botrytis byssoidea TaxID=139641 RepID=A0A9P5IUP0_9HELO|nr:uncharacterized protein EAE97_002462 [Botrytis byssoidea]KAF7950910.1 hypothetical protein EAE97_002462 [Botrytis byssoidea]